MRVDTFLKPLGPVCAVIGAQWGDEGKGKVIDILAEHFDVIARACGGANAGHTIVVNGKKHVFHLLPAGSLHEGKKILLGSGMVIHLPTLVEEIQTLRDAGVDVVPRLGISTEAHIVLDYYRDIDTVMEQRRTEGNGKKIGTTNRGIGPAYTEKAARTGMRMGDLRAFFSSPMKANLQQELQRRKSLAKEMYGVDVDTAKEESMLRAAYDAIGTCLVPMEIIYDFLDAKKRILVEGAQATLLDIDHGTYPYVTSSSTTAAGALQGLGLPPNALTSCIGVAKAYCTRVGEGTFLTEETGAIGERLRERGGEYGATTGRPRRCGWLHMPDLNFSSRINGCTCWNITKLDVLDEEDVVRVGGVDESGFLSLEEFPGWKTSTRGITQFADLPERAQTFLRHIEDKTSIPVQFIGTGPGREEMIIRP